MRTSLQLSDLLFPNQTRRKVLAWVLMHPEQSIHLRELARRTQATPGTLKKELDALGDVGLLHRQRIGNQVQFRANTEHPVFPELQALVRKTIGLSDVLQQALAPLQACIELAFVFGSMASGSAHAGSDVDVLIVGDVGFGQVIEALHPAQVLLGREINPKVMTSEEWAKKRAEGNPFIQDLLTRPRLILQEAPHA